MPRNMPKLGVRSALEGRGTQRLEDGIGGVPDVVLREGQSGCSACEKGDDSAEGCQVLEADGGLGPCLASSSGRKCTIATVLAAEQVVEDVDLESRRFRLM